MDNKSDNKPIRAIRVTLLVTAGTDTDAGVTLANAFGHIKDSCTSIIIENIVVVDIE